LQPDALWHALGPIAERSQATQPVLVVDDDSASRELMRAALEARNLPVVLADGGAQALALLDAVQPCAMILDLLMPEIDGFQVLDALSRSQRWADLPVLIWTAMSLTREQFDGLRGSAAKIAARGPHDSVQVIRNALLKWGHGAAGTG
ncbi:MAG: response regulator, partial [Paucibacter sp.]|nr:response regulator [Roseateles sp.]